MSSRTDILNCLRKQEKAHKEEPLPEWQDKNLYCDYPGSSNDLIDLFDTQLKKLSGSLHLVSSIEEAASRLKDLLKKIDPLYCGAHQSPLIHSIKKSDKELAPFLSFVDDESITSEDFSKLKIGITEADCLIARTGSILIHSTSSGGRRLSVLPPTHIVVAEQKQIVPSLEDALQQLDQTEDNWSYATMITGPSRTSDIEKQLVLGAHGPKHLIVILIKD
jgi:L-lactate dehydrogenase complex protein LldG